MRKNYNRESAVAYAQKFALSHNPAYYHFGGIGGDCTNFISQCVFAGSGVMNYNDTYGWYYTSPSFRSPSWTSVEHFQKFLLTNVGVGPFGKLVSKNELEVGDIIQLKQINRYNHTLIITKIQGNEIYICAHSTDALNRNLNSYPYKQIAYIKILGVRV